MTFPFFPLLTKSQLVAAWSKYEEERAKEAKERKKGGQGGVLLSKNFNEANEPIRTALKQNADSKNFNERSEPIRTAAEVAEKRRKRYHREGQKKVKKNQVKIFPRFLSQSILEQRQRLHPR